MKGKLSTLGSCPQDPERLKKPTQLLKIHPTRCWGALQLLHGVCFPFLSPEFLSPFAALLPLSFPPLFLPCCPAHPFLSVLSAGRCAASQRNWQPPFPKPPPASSPPGWSISHLPSITTSVFTHAAFWGLTCPKWGLRRGCSPEPSTSPQG